MKLGRMFLAMCVVFSLTLLSGGTSQAAANTPTPCGTPTIVTIWAGQNTNAGTVTAYNDATTLYVTFATTGDWMLRATHLHVASSLSGIPSNVNGGPAPGKFMYKTVHNPMVTTFTYAIPLSTLTGTEWYIAAHAEVVRVVNGTIVQEETGWAGDDPFPGNNWARYFRYTLQECAPPPPPPAYEGCTPGYWKNHTAAWAATGYTTTQTVSSVFRGADASLANATLLQALSFRGGSTIQGAQEILLRAGVAALLNSAHPDVDYTLSTAQVITKVNSALLSGDRRTIISAAKMLDEYNNAGCDLGN